MPIFGGFIAITSDIWNQKFWNF